MTQRPQEQQNEQNLPTETTPLFSKISVEDADIQNVVQSGTAKPGESIVDDIFDILKLGVPIAISYLSWIGVSFE
jgi:hypothetical protein